MSRITCVFVMPCLMALFGAIEATRPLTSSFDGDDKGIAVIKPTFAGYLPVSADGSALYYAYYEAAASSEDLGEAPIVLWLQVSVSGRFRCGVEPGSTNGHWPAVVPKRQKGSDTA